MDGQEAIALIEQIAKQHGFTADQIRGRRRYAKIVEARHAIACALRARGLSLPLIGRLLQRHHTTILYACGKPESQLSGANVDGGRDQGSCGDGVRHRAGGDNGANAHRAGSGCASNGPLPSAQTNEAILHGAREEVQAQ